MPTTSSNQLIDTTCSYRCLIKLKYWDDKVSSTSTLKGIVTDFNTKTINVAVPNKEVITFTYNQERKGWDSSVDDGIIFADLQPDPLQSEEDYNAVEAMISIND
jgi:hypothetical protein